MKRLFTAARLTLSIGALAAVLWRVDARQAFNLLGDAKPSWIGVALAANCVAVVLSTLLWRTMMEGSRPRFIRMLCAYLQGLFYNNVGVGTVFGDASRVDALLSEGVNARQAAGSVLAERFLSFLALLLLSSVGACALWGDRSALAISIWSASVACLAILSGTMLWGPRVVALRLWPAPVRSILNECARSAASLGRHPRRLLVATAVALSVQTCTVVATMAVLNSLGEELSLMTAFLTVPVIALSVLLPFSVQGIGVREATYVYVLSTVGVPAEVALSGAFLSFSITLLISASGGLVVLSGAIQSVSARRGSHNPQPPIRRSDEVDARAA